jgi:hypothetical protein
MTKNIKNIFFSILILSLYACENTKNEEKTNSITILPTLDSTAITTTEIYPDSLIDISVVAGKKFSVLHSKISFDDLQKIFGEQHVKTYRDTISGKAYATSVLFETQPNELQITWHNEELLQYPNYCYFKHPQAVWQADKGIKIGTTLAEIVKMNEKAVEIVGLGSRYEGGLIRFKGGKLQEFSKYYNLFVGYDATDLPKIDKSLLGENSFDSQNVLLKNLNLKVVKIQAYLNK